MSELMTPLGRRWTVEEHVRLVEMLAGGATREEVAAALGRSLHAVAIRHQRYGFCPIDRRTPTWGSGSFGGKFWTPERIEAGLRDFAERHQGKLPSSDHAYKALKRAHPEWPTAAAVLEQWGSMVLAWQALGMPRSRYSSSNHDWSQEDDDVLLGLAGEMTLKLIARRLGRSWQACRRRLFDLGAGRARDVSGHLSMMQVAAEYGCPLTRVKRLVRSGELPAKRVYGGHYWRIAPEDCEAIKEKLSAPKVTHTSTPPDDGRYDLRYRLRRVRVNGRVVRVADTRVAS